MTLTKKFFCPVNGWDCPYWKKDGSCSMVDDGDNPVEECDDAAYFCEDGEDPFVWETEDGKRYDMAELLVMGYHFVNGEPVSSLQDVCESVKILRHILDARIDHAASPELYTAWTSARDIVEYALADNVEALRQFDYLLTNEDCGIGD